MEIDTSLIEEAQEKEKLEKLEEEFGYARFREDFGKIPRGTVLTKARTVWGFPHIHRIFTLEAGVARNIKDDEVYVEEKIDGFNLRVALVEGKIFAFSRGGFIDAFATEKVREMGLEGFFKEFPDYVLCGEMIGNTPYTDPTDKFDVKLFVFDIDDGTGNYLPCSKMFELLKEYKIQSVPLVAKCKKNDTKKLREIVLSLNKAGKEGMVIKAADRKTLVKYVTPAADVEDIASCAKLIFDMPAGFFHQRVVRSAFFLKDFALDRGEYGARLGKAFYDGLLAGLKELEEGRGIENEFEITVNDEKIWERIRKHMSSDVRLSVLFKRKEGEKTRIRFLKTYKKSTKKLGSWMKGTAITD